MFKILSKEETKIIEKKLDFWWQKLDFNIKQRVKLLIEPVQEYSECIHEFAESRVNNIVYCKNCPITKPGDYLDFLNWCNLVKESTNNYLKKFDIDSDRSIGNIIACYYANIGDKMEEFYREFTTKITAQDFSKKFIVVFLGEYFRYDGHQGIYYHRNIEEQRDLVNQLKEELRASHISFPE